MTSNGTGKSAKERQAEHRRRLQAAGLVAVTEWVPAQVAGDVKAMCHRLRTDTDLVPGPLRRISNGRLERI